MNRALIAFCASSLLATATHATTITVIEGEALVSHGDGFESIKGVADLVPGDMVMAKAGSSAKVTFSNGCTVFLGMGLVFNVPAQAPCDGEGNAGATTGAIPDAAASPAQDWSAVTQTTVATGPSQTNIMPYVLGAAAIGGISVGALAFSGGGGDGGGGTPASP